MTPPHVESSRVILKNKARTKNVNEVAGLADSEALRPRAPESYTGTSLPTELSRGGPGGPARRDLVTRSSADRTRDGPGRGIVTRLRLLKRRGGRSGRSGGRARPPGSPYPVRYRLQSWRG
eukprot:36668-Hanusia_phi.AAC.1